MPKGEIVLIPFPFTNLTDIKIRPCLVLIEAAFDITVSFITTQTGWNDEGSVAVKPSAGNGLKKDSLIRLNKLATIDKELILGKIGKLDINEMDLVNLKLKKILQL
jgi:mRNA interferase MazF